MADRPAITVAGPQPSSESQPQSILVVGAGYAGLAFANRIRILQGKEADESRTDNKDNNNHRQQLFTITVVDALHPPERGVLHGTLRIPQSQKLLNPCLGIDLDRSSLGGDESPQSVSSPKCTEPSDPRDEDLQFALRANIPVHYRLRVLSSILETAVGVDTNEKDSGTTKKITASTTSRAKRRVYAEQIPVYESSSSRTPIGTVVCVGSFDWVVAADGATSRLVHTACRRPWSSCWTAGAGVDYAIGDARWTARRWWDLGSRRLARGADIAIQDGVELADALVQQYTKQQRQNATTVVNKRSLGNKGRGHGEIVTHYASNDKDSQVLRRKFHISAIAKSSRLSWLLVLGVLIPLLSLALQQGKPIS